MRSPLPAFLSLLSILAVVGCSNPGDAADGADPAGAATANLQPPGGEESLGALVEGVQAAWAAKSPTAYASFYAEDARFTNPLGVTFAGRESVRTVHAALFGGPFAQSSLTVELQHVRFMTGTIAVLELTFSLSGYTALPPGLRETSPGVQRNRVRWVVLRRDGAWEIVAQQMTPVPPAP